ncbi:sugar-binding transcriptional regulator [Agilicoccus flavus]|uniref:sugar-binding transcriptional regulator n=1 Tax=Agilicoccus flavus TaxID=2775968 RepID=UPI001CF65DD3|nr:sugar-binding domain-containing protein [Agilicoccus flavus]
MSATQGGERATGPDALETLALDDLMQMAAVARRHYVDGRSRVEIAEEFGLSRFKVSRVLEMALRTGIVTIDIRVPESVDADLSLRLRRSFGLRRAIVVTPRDSEPQTVRDALGAAGARLLDDIVGTGDVLGLSSGRTIDATTRRTGRLTPREIVQLTGMSGNLSDNPVELVRRLVSSTDGRVQLIYAPLTVATAEAARALKADPAIAAAFDAFDRVTIALIAVGSWDPPDSRFFDGLPQGQRDRMLARGVQADIAGILFDRTGRHIPDFDDHVLGVSLPQLRAVPERLLIAGGPKKTDSIRAALHANLVTSLVTDTSVAQALLVR